MPRLCGKLIKQYFRAVKHFPMTIAALLPEHWAAVKTIYEQGIATGQATFQTDAPAWEEWNASHLSHSRLVAIEDNQVIGWAALTPVSGRCVYAGVAEVSVYIEKASRGKGIGKALLGALIAESEKNNLWTLQAGIFPENQASIRIHEKCGFRQLGIREKIGQHHGVWRDTVLLERRSKKIGIQ
jgi:phosphinothricin acetyltransferase